MPHEERPSRYAIGPFDRSIHYWGLHSQRPDIMLTIRILHRQSHEQPVDECEDRCLKEMEARLRELGACRLQWADPKTKGAEIKRIMVSMPTSPPGAGPLRTTRLPGPTDAADARSR